MAKTTNSGTSIKEIILENFMSYQYARIPFKPGLNIICGPNGAGKSSILLALAVALGQTYTERSRKLSDLIRRGEDMARVSVVFDNSSEDGRRPIQSVKSDAFVLSRYMKKDGTYWHEANYRTVTKGEVRRTLSRLVVNPDNMLIVMHQGMIDLFSAIDAQERLRIVEEAVGLREYRERIFDAREKLSHTLSEEESIKNLLEKATETLKYWEGEYQRYQQKRRLEGRRERLEREYAWSKWEKQRSAVNSISAKISDLKSDLEEIGGGLKKVKEEGEKSGEDLKKLDYDQESSYQELITHEKEAARVEARLELAQELARTSQTPGSEELGEVLAGLGKDVDGMKSRLKEVKAQADEIKSVLVKIKTQREKEHERYVNLRVREALLEFRRELVEKEISSLKSDLRRARRELRELEAEAEGIGPKLETERKPREVLDEIRVVNAQLVGLTDVSPDVEKMYRNYKDLLKELREKAEVAAANREKALEELEARKGRWSEGLRKLLRKVRETYGEILKRVNAAGSVRLINPQDIDDAGLELLVGFRGAEPQTLDAYTQSGGERTTSIMCFLLALQQHIKSPIRAIDEFDVHMDPRNRETMMKQLLSLMEESEAQYIVITPGRLVDVEEVPSVVTVQNVAGSSKVKVAA
jgi:chromosome segregation ATPase